jgi:hypothetical protein
MRSPAMSMRVQVRILMSRVGWNLIWSVVTGTPQMPATGSCPPRLALAVSWRGFEFT